MDNRTLRSIPKSGHRVGNDRAKRRRGSKVAPPSIPSDTSLVPARRARDQDRAEVGDLARSLQEEEATAEGVDLALVDWDYTGEEAASDAEVHGIRLEVVKHPLAKKGFVPLPRRWVVERSFAWATPFRRSVKDYERLPETVAGLHFVAPVYLFLNRAIAVLGSSP